MKSVRVAPFLILVAGVSLARAQEPSAPAMTSGEAAALLRAHGCLGCHSLDGEPLVGPPLAGVDPRPDAEAIRAALRDPVAPMPPYALADAQIGELVEAVARVEAEPKPGFRSVVPMAIGGLLFVLFHLGLSSRPLRGRLVRRLGPARFQALYSLTALVGFVLLMVGWRYAPFVELWSSDAKWMRHLPLTLVPLGLFLVVASNTTKNPTSAGQAEAAAEPPRGIITVTRHPGLWGWALFALAHIPVNGDLAALIFFGSFVVLAFAGMLHIDARRRSDAPEVWARFASQTSIVPFAAILRGKTRLDTTGMLRALVVSVVVIALAVLGHEWLFGVPALPYEWVHG